MRNIAEYARREPSFSKFGRWSFRGVTLYVTGDPGDEGRQTTDLQTRANRDGLGSRRLVSSVVSSRRSRLSSPLGSMSILFFMRNLLASLALFLTVAHSAQSR